jgi:hypothetical protein
MAPIAAKDWFMAADKFRLNAAKGTASFTFKVGSMSTRQAALMAMVGAISGGPIPDALNYELDSFFLNIFGNAYSLHAWNGLKGNVSQGSQFSDSNVVSPVAFRRTGAVLYNADVPIADPSQFIIRGQWILKQVLNFADTFVVP